MTKCCCTCHRPRIKGIRDRMREIRISPKFRARRVMANLLKSHEREQNRLAEAIGLTIGGFVKVSADWPTSGCYPRHGQKLVVTELHKIADSIWVAVTPFGATPNPLILHGDGLSRRGLTAIYSYWEPWLDCDEERLFKEWAI